MQFILLFGPPGSGKSTTIEAAQKEGFVAYDLEKFAHGLSDEAKQQRKEKAEELVRNYEKENGVMLVGMADVHASSFPQDAVSVILLPSFEVYKARLEKRDTENEGKRGQGGIEYQYASFTERAKTSSHVIMNDGSVEETLIQLKQLIHK